MVNTMNWKLSLFLVFLFFSCGSKDTYKTDPAPTPKVITHYNIAMVPDLSNRIDQNVYRRQLHDSSVYRVVLKLIPELVHDNGRLTMQKDKFSLRLLNSYDVMNYNDLQPSLTIDLGGFGPEQMKRIDYLKNRGNGTLEKDVRRFMTAVHAVYQEAMKKGYTADVWGFFNQSLKDTDFKLTEPIDHPEARAKDVSRNILILITDGYVDIKDQDKSACKEKVCKWLSAAQIEKFRTYYHEAGKGQSLEAAFESSGYGLTPVANNSLADIEILMLEVYDRSKDASGRLTREPSDFEILNLFWSDFFKKSGVKRYKIVEACSSEAQLEASLRAFIQDK